jgi:hypothetical protein
MKRRIDTSIYLYLSVGKHFISSVFPKEIRDPMFELLRFGL